jgi:hypothetical protein
MRNEKTKRDRQSDHQTHGQRPRNTRPRHPLAPAVTIAASLTLAGCIMPHPLKGGKALTARSNSGRFEQTLIQGDNAAQQSRQTQDTVRVRTFTLPAGARMEEATVVSSETATPLTNIHSIVLTQPMPVTEREETRAASELGAAQKDTTRELGARLASLRGITWLGVVLFLFGLTSLVWPPLKLIVGSVTTSAAVLVGGIILIILPTLVAGNELLILGAVGLTAGAWFLAHRHGQLRGLLSAPGAKSAIQASSTASAVTDASASKPN